MKDIFRINILLDFYKEMLTEHQVNILELYANNDYTLTEIAELLNSSRQNVYDNIKRGMKQLEEYENKLQLYKKYVMNQDKFESIKQLLDETSNKEVIALIKEIVER